MMDRVWKDIKQSQNVLLTNIQAVGSKIDNLRWEQLRSEIATVDYKYNMLLGACYALPSSWAPDIFVLWSLEKI